MPPSLPQPLDPIRAGAIGDALKASLDRIQRACDKAGRPHGAVQLLLATKTQPAAAIRAAIQAGGTLIGENRVQELVAKGPELADLPHQAHMIGPLQSNKIPAALRWADCIQTVAGLALAAKLSHRSAERPTPLEVMVQVNTSGEATKSGVEPGQAPDLAAQVAALPGLRLVGFMTIGLNSADATAVGLSFARLREVRDAVLAAGDPATAGATHLSMGMSGDLEIAIAEGATMVRLGTAIFGPRG
ncbi:MAG: YggS family pyridoxal phosphate-dependent enzyme [Bifidobacteriaceae bacterium]|nr:YggS family pyridoxal phosphate-dependent enzyme [Bifidobacteriaceae bacterium]